MNRVISFIISIPKRNLVSNGFTCMRNVSIASELRDYTSICNGRLKSRYATLRANISLLKINKGPNNIAYSISVLTLRYNDMNLGLKSGFSSFAFYFYKNKQAKTGNPKTNIVVTIDRDELIIPSLSSNVKLLSAMNVLIESFI